MIFTPHLIVGTAIGARIRKPGLILILGILSHILMDLIPHWEYTTTIPRMIIDFATGFIILFFILYKRKLFKLNDLIYIALGIFAALIPDILLGVAQIIKTGGFATLYLYVQQNFIHSRKVMGFNFMGVFPQLAVIAIGIGLILGRGKNENQ
jgi:hypothetical protein